jgi:hypothetical protein
VNSLVQADLFIEFSDSYGIIRCFESILSRSTQESGLSQKGKKEKRKGIIKRQKKRWALFMKADMS